jgi:flagellar hook-associated protein 1 FlgK
MSLSGALNAAISGIGANQRQIQVISGNVSNANVEGFTKKSLPQSTQVVGLDTNGGVETGVVQREVNEFLRGRIQSAESELSFDKTKQEFFKRVQDFFGTVDSNSTISNSISDLRTAIEDLTINPENSAIQQQVVSKAQALAGQFRTFTQNAQELRAEADLQIKQSVQSVNENLQQVKDLNAEIAQAEALGKSSANLRDQRDTALKEISQQIDISTFERETGEIVVVSADEQARQLVDGSAAELQFDAAGSLGSGEPGGEVQYSDGSTVDPDSIGGRMGALLQLRDQDLANFQADLDRLAAQVREEVNSAHNLATKGNEPQSTIQGTHRFTDDKIAGVGGANGITGASGSFEILDVNSNGEVVDTTTVDLGANSSGIAGATTTTQLRTELNNAAGGGNNPFTVAGNGQLTVEDPDGSGNRIVIRQTEGATIAADNIAPTAEDAGGGDRKRNFSHFFGLNNLMETPDQNAKDSAGNNLPQPASNPDLVTGDTQTTSGADDARTGPGVSAAGVIQVREDIAMDPSKLGRISPSSGNGDTALPVGNAKIARELANAFENKTTFAEPGAYETTGGSSNVANLAQNPTGGNVGGRTVTLAGFAADILQDQASRTADIEKTVQAQKGVQEQLELRAQNQSGVNIDEELARLSTFQQAFNANARVISVVDELFSTLNQAVR